MMTVLCFSPVCITYQRRTQRLWPSMAQSVISMECYHVQMHEHPIITAEARAYMDEGSNSESSSISQATREIIPSQREMGRP